MARIGRQIPHFKEIIPESISAEFSNDKLYRYTLSMDYSDNLINEERNESVTVILKNPSSADEKKSDATIRKVETYVYKHFPRVKKLNILNIFAIRATDVKEVNKLLRENGKDYITGPDNDNWFEKTIKNSDHIICAWGNNNGIKKGVYEERIKLVKNMLKTSGKPFYAIFLKGTQKQPLHGLMWSFSYKLKDYSVQ